MSSNNSGKGGGSSSRAKTKSILVKLKLPSKELAAFPHEKLSIKASIQKQSTSESSSPPPASTQNSPPAAEINEGNITIKAEVNGENGTSGQTDTENKKKGAGAAAKAGTKRNSGALNDGLPKVRGKPGPKRRKGEGDEANRPWTTPNAGVGGHKLGPKANQGAINAGLRALDRTGKPCRKWDKRGFSIKSFTGVEWSLHSWTAPVRLAEAKADNVENTTPTSNSENPQASSNVGSEVSHHQADLQIKDVPSSPAVVSTPV